MESVVFVLWINVAEAITVRLEGDIFAVSGTNFVCLLSVQAHVVDLIALVPVSEVSFIPRLTGLDSLFNGEI